MWIFHLALYLDRNYEIIHYNLRIKKIQFFYHHFISWQWKGGMFLYSLHWFPVQAHYNVNDDNGVELPGTKNKFKHLILKPTVFFLKIFYNTLVSNDLGNISSDVEDLKDKMHRTLFALNREKDHYLNGGKVPNIFYQHKIDFQRFLHYPSITIHSLKFTVSNILYMKSHAKIIISAQ